MQIAVAAGDALQHEAALVALCVAEGASLPAAIAGLIEAEDWAGTFKQTLLLYPRGALPARRLLLVGGGKLSELSPERLREIGALVAQRARTLKVDAYTLALPETLLDPQHAAQALSEGSLLGVYRFLTYKTGLKHDDLHDVATLTLLTPEPSEAAVQGAMLGQAIAQAVVLARDLANGPGNDVTPTKLGETAQELGARFGMHVTVLGPAELRAQGFGGILGVAQGSAQEPRFIVLEHGAQRDGVPTVCLVGKGITFDTGGISIKPAAGMEDMKMDMGGAAAVLGAMQAVGALDLPLHVVGLIACAENMPSATAYKPGDILKTLSGKTIEVINTDAEGRVVLADALFYAQRYQPDGVVDLATLTGAIMVALGPHAIGMMSNNDGLAARLTSAGALSGEMVWRLPLTDPYREMVKSDIADVKNSTGRPGGAITAAAFLENFVGDVPWVHLDIAGTAWTDRQTKGYLTKGATGVGVRLLVEMLRAWVA